MSILEATFGAPIVRVRDVDASLDWWRSVLGVDAGGATGRGDQRWASFAIGPFVLSLWQLPDGVERDRAHNDRNTYVVFVTAADIHELRDRLIERGVDVGRMQEIATMHFFWFHDLDGNRFEISRAKEHR